jgi:branched-chain amino acid transport system substrate-binding protein
MRRRTAWAALGVLTLALAVFVGGAAGKPAAGKPIVIGAAVDLTKNMSPFDAPALAAAQIEIAKINAKGGINGRPLQLKFINDQLDPNKTKQAAATLIGQGVDIGWVTCDVDFATPAAQAFLQAHKLTVAPCIGTDEMSPLRFGALGKLAFSFGNAAQDEGSAMAEYAYKNGWHSSVVVTDNLLRYFKDVCKAYSIRFQQLGGKIVAQESFTQGDKTINNVVSRVNGKKADNVAFCTSFGGDQPAFVSGLRSLNNDTPIINSWAGDGNYWWPKSPKVTNYYYVTYASVWGDDPSKAVKGLIGALKKAGHPPGTGGFVTGAAAIDGIATALRIAHGSTNGATLASIIEKFHKQPTISGLVSFSPQLHSVFGRQYRVIKVNDNKARLVGTVTAQKIANIHG